ncbi:MAG: DUF952 domain-containing protein [Actinomycetota bacterium]
MSGLIYHIASAADWAQARAAGEYTTSTRGLTLDQVGYLHAAHAHQVAGVANAFYAGEPDLVVLVIDTALVGPEIRLDSVPGSDEPFPHIYGPLNADAVTAVLPLRPGPDGRFSFAA